MHIFKTFPEFSTLTLADRDRYNDLIANYPPISNFSFPNLMTWWSSLANCMVAQLNGNLIIAYWLPGDEEHSGLSIVGTHKIDETIATIFDELIKRNEEPKLVLVPEFVISNMHYPELYNFNEQRKYDECILEIRKFASLDKIVPSKRSKIRRFLEHFEGKRIVVEELNVDDTANKELLFELSGRWNHKGRLNRTNSLEEESFYSSMKYAEQLGFSCICLYIDGEPHGYLLFQLPSDPDYVIVNYARFSYELPHIFELGAYKFSEWFVNEGVKFANIDADFGLGFLRTLKLSLAPSNFFRFYSVQPKR